MRFPYKCQVLNIPVYFGQYLCFKTQKNIREKVKTKFSQFSQIDNGLTESGVFTIVMS